MPIAKQLPSGSWRCRVYFYQDAAGKQHYKSFTCDDPSQKGKYKCEAEAAAWAAAWAADRESHILSPVTFRAAAKEYIDNRTAICSPRTIEEYTAYLDRYLSGLSSKRIDSISLRDVQAVVNAISAGRSPKTARNVYGFLRSVLAAYGNHLNGTPKLPSPKAADLHIPTEDEIRRIMAGAEGTSLELPILLAAFGPMRRGEICALRAESIDGNTVHVYENMVRKKVDGVKTWVVKVPKSPAGHRYIEYPDFVAEKWKGKTGRIVTICPDTITKSFDLLLKDLGVEHFRFHDLRHYSASIQHALGIPDAYIMQRGGWSSDRVLKAVYRHAMDDKTRQMTAIANDYFTALHDTET